MNFMKRKSSLAFVALFIALLALPSLFSSNTKKVEASAAAQNPTSANDLKKSAKAPRPPHIPSGMAPANDNCTNAINVTCPTFTDTKNTSGATDETGEPVSSCTVSGSNVWYTYVNNTGNSVIVDVALCNSDFDTAVEVYKVNGAACDFANFASVACNDDVCGDGFQSQVSFTADPGATYKIQAGGFDGDTGSLTINITCQELTCPVITVNGTLGSGSPDHPSTSGLQTPNRIFRDAVISTCAAPKTCPGTFNSGSFNFDAYTFTNESDTAQCVTVNYNPDTAGINPGGVALHAIAYLGTYVPTNLCTNYLADVGSSLAQPFSFTVPAGQNFVIVIAENTPGAGLAKTYQFSVVGNICAGFDLCVQQDAPKRFLEINTTSGAYRYTDCSKNIVREGTGAAFEYFCKITFSGTGVNSSATALVNPCTKRGDATIVVPLGVVTQVVKIADKDVTNNDCECPR